jgi:hypothetical protein
MQQEDPLEALESLEADIEEVAEVLAQLRALLARASHPVVRSWIEAAHDDIAHLTGRRAASRARRPLACSG